MKSNLRCVDSPAIATVKDSINPSKLPDSPVNSLVHASKLRDETMTPGLPQSQSSIKIQLSSSFINPKTFSAA